MNNQLDAQKLIDAVIEQRNTALNQLAQARAYIAQLEEEAKKVESDEDPIASK